MTVNASSSPHLAPTVPGLSSAPVSIISLPPEVAARCLELGLDSIKPTFWRPKDEQYPFLLSASLISRCFTYEARSLLWRKVRIKNDRQANALLCSKGWAQYRTEALELRGTSEKLYYQVLKGLEGLRKLNIGYIGGGKVTWSIFTSPNLQDVTSLKLDEAFFSPDDFGIPVFPFSLTSLNLRRYGSHSSKGFLSFYQSSLTTLSIDEFSILFNGKEAEFLSLFKLLAPQLEGFQLVDRQEQYGGAFPDLIPLFGNFINLSDLSLECRADELAEVITLIPSSLHHLRWLPTNYQLRTHTLSEALRKASSVAKLERFTFGGLSRRGVKKMDWGEYTIQTLEHLGVTSVEFETENGLCLPSEEGWY